MCSGFVYGLSSGLRRFVGVCATARHVCASNSYRKDRFSQSLKYFVVWGTVSRARQAVPPPPVTLACVAVAVFFPLQARKEMPQQQNILYAHFIFTTQEQGGSISLLMWRLSKRQTLPVCFLNVQVFLKTTTTFLPTVCFTGLITIFLL